MAYSSLFYYHTSNTTLILLVYLDLLHLSSQHHILLACVILELSIISCELKLLMVLTPCISAVNVGIYQALGSAAV